MIAPAPNPALSVSQLNQQARLLLEKNFGMITVEGEISNFARPSSGHWYFTLKDSGAQVRCALFRNRNTFLKYRPKNGDLVRLRARVSLYEGRGEFQLIGDYLEEAGSGALQAAFDALKQRLQLEGLFDPAHKRSLPGLPRHIGIITSPTGAALRDILSVLKRRFAAIPVTLYPALVQGDEAAKQLRSALALANRDQRCDVLIISRGGGSLEDLWPFNDEALARAIFSSNIPVVSAVGHEVDFSIADFVADQRAATPSAAAELVSPDAAQLGAQFRDSRQRLVNQISRRLIREKERLNWLSQRLKHPGQRLQEQTQQLDNLELRLHRAMQRRLFNEQQREAQLRQRLARQNPLRTLGEEQTQVQQLSLRLCQGMQRRLDAAKQSLAAMARELHAVSPLATLERGYAIITTPDQTVITQADKIKVGDNVEARLANGRLRCTVTESLPASH